MNAVVVLETVRRFVTRPAFVVFVMLLGMFALGSSRANQPGFLWADLLGFLVLVAGGSLIGPELSSGTMQLVLTKPVNRSVYLVSRWTGVVALISGTVLLLAFIEAAARLLWAEGKGMEGLAVLALNRAVSSTLACALLALFGVLLRSYLSVGLYVFLAIALDLAPTALAAFARIESGIFALPASFVAAHPEITTVLLWLNENLFPVLPPKPDAESLLLVLSNTAIVLVLASLAFRRKEVPYGAD